MIAVALFLLLSVGCGSQAGQTANGTPAPAATPTPQAIPRAENHSVGDLGKAGVPELSPEQFKQLRAVETRVSPEVRRRLRFAFARSGNARWFVVYDGGGYPPAGDPSHVLPIVLNPPYGDTFHYDPAWNEVVQ